MMCSLEMQWALTAMAQKAKTPLKMQHKSCHSACSASPSGVPEVRVTTPSFTLSSRRMLGPCSGLQGWGISVPLLDESPAGWFLPSVHTEQYVIFVQCAMKTLMAKQVLPTSDPDFGIYESPGV